jgi:hypothetical protein
MSDDPTTRILAAIGELRSEVAAFCAEVVARIDRLQDGPTAPTESGIVNASAADRAERIAKAAHDEAMLMREQINSLVRQLRNLSGRIDRIEDRQR